MVANAVVDVVLLHVAHEFERKGRGEDAGVLRLVFLENIGLDRSTHRLEGSCLDLSVGLGVHHFVAPSSHGGQSKPVVPFGEFASVGRVKQLHRLALLDQVGFHLLVDGSVEEEGENDGRWPVDGHRDRGVGVAQIKAGVEPLGVVGRGDGNTGIADLAPNVRAASRVPSVERDRVKGRGKTNVVLALAQVVEAAVGALGLAFTCKHAGRQFVGSLEREHTGRVGEVSRSILFRDEFVQLPVVLGLGQGDTRDVGVRQRFGRGLDLERLATDVVGVLA